MIYLFRQMLGRVRSFLHKAPLDGELDAEIASHLEMAVEENTRRGMHPEEARRRAMIRFGGLQQAREQHRETRGLPWMDVLMQDLRFTSRTLAKDRGFTIIAVLILGLGIGANVAVFSVVNTILLRPLPFHDPERLVRIVEKNAGTNESAKTYTADATQDYQQQNRSFQSVSGYFAFTGPDNLKLVGNGQPLPVTGILVAENFFQTLGVDPFMGRLFRSEEFVKHAQPVALLGYPFWKRQLGGDRSIVGQTINLSNTSVTVIGVLPETWDFGSVFSPGAKVDLFMPYIMDDFRDDGNDLALVGRLKPGVTLAAAQREADEIFPRLLFDHKHPNDKAGYTGQLTGLKDYISGKLRRSLIVLWCAVGLILLIVCVNLSNLLLARTAARSKEFAMRSALGANRWRLARQLLTESLVLSGAGAILGLAIAYAVTAYLAHQGSIALPLLSSVHVDGKALAWTLLIAVAAGVLFGIAPALRMSRNDLQESLKDSGHGTSDGRKHERMRSVLVISEVALACMLLVGAGLLLRSFLKVLEVDLGFEPSRAAAISVDYDDGGSTAKRTVIWQEVVRRASMLPGVEAAGISDNLPMSRNRGWGIAAKGQEKPRDSDFIGVFVYIASPGYLKAMGMRLMKGRDISWEDLANNENVVIINETVAKKLWPGQDPIGRTAIAGGQEARVIGVIADVRESSAEDNGGAQMYLPATKNFGPEGCYLVVRSKLPPATLGTSLMRTLQEMNPGQPATEFRPIQALVDHAVSPRKFFVLLVSIFAGLGLLLASLGIYGVISYSVTRQTQEIGIRMALGATRSKVQLGVIGRTMRLALIGILLGGAASFVMARAIASLLYGTEPTDPETFAGMVLLLGSVALLAGYLPARRASRIDPMIALRTN
ncbi:ABC transporter permease [Alloacidobacterium dinghuense]|uniref:ABC transporter permease n=1 Tax=Alloacidobacterium dinghuense TaxID=2763107 RepID=A0A7G8BCD8_9BACT|nr:ABC transporter permease [Alloacidobacterium dinghuense]QNI30208.1 ABC transporter permease [Alloacidobacterium dinghuense]